MGSAPVAPDRLQAFLAEYEGRELVRVLTAGSVDDGKSTLIGRLLFDTRAVYDDHLAAVRRDSEHRGQGELDLSLLTDGLRAEREQGITIDVAYRYFSTAHRKFILADCPGHEQYTRNMATGASNCDLAIVLVDARQGVLRQTRRHAFIASLLGIRHMVVAVNKMDLVGWSEAVFDAIRTEFAEFSARLDVADVRFIPISALAGDNVVEPSRHMPWYSGETLLHVLESVHIASDRNFIDLRFPVQFVNRVGQDFRGLCGTVASGVIRPGDELIALPSRQRCRASAVLVDGRPVDEAAPPMAVTLTLDEDVDVSRGDVLVHPGNLPRVEQTFEAMVVWMAEEPLVPGRQYFIKQTTRLVTGQATALHYRIDVNTLHRTPASELAMNEVGRCTVLVSRALAFDPYRQNRSTGAFILIDRQTNRTVGAGMILDRQPEPAGVEEAAGPGAAAVGLASTVRPDERAARFGQQPAVVALGGAGRTRLLAIASLAERRLFDAGRAPCVIEVRQPADVHAAHLLADAGLIVLCVAAEREWLASGPAAMVELRVEADASDQAAADGIVAALAGRGLIPSGPR